MPITAHAPCGLTKPHTKHLWKWHAGRFPAFADPVFECSGSDWPEADDPSLGQGEAAAMQAAADALPQPSPREIARALLALSRAHDKLRLAEEHRNSSVRQTHEAGREAARARAVLERLSSPALMLAHLPTPEPTQAEPLDEDEDED